MLKQHEPINNHINQLDRSGAELLCHPALLGLQRLFPADPGLPGRQHQPVHRAQHACDPPDLKSFKENVHLQSLKAFGHRVAEAGLAEAAAQAMGQVLARRAGRSLQRRDTESGAGCQVAAGAGAAKSWAIWRHTARSC